MSLCEGMPCLLYNVDTDAQSDTGTYTAISTPMLSASSLSSTMGFGIATLQPIITRDYSRGGHGLVWLGCFGWYLPVVCHTPAWHTVLVAAATSEPPNPTVGPRRRLVGARVFNVSFAVSALSPWDIKSSQFIESMTVEKPPKRYETSQVESSQVICTQQ